MTAAEIATVIDVSKNTVESWTKEGFPRNPGEANIKKIEQLYDDLEPCFDNLDKIENRTPVLE